MEQNCVWLLHNFNIQRNYGVFKSKSPRILLNKYINFNKSEMEKLKIPHTVLDRRTLRFNSYRNLKLKVKLWLYRLFCTREIFITFVFYLNILFIEYTFRIYILLHIKKHYFIHFCCLFLKLSKAFRVSLSKFNFSFHLLFRATTEILLYSYYL